MTGEGNLISPSRCRFEVVMISIVLPPTIQGRGRIAVPSPEMDQRINSLKEANYPFLWPNESFPIKGELSYHTI